MDLMVTGLPTNRHDAGAFPITLKGTASGPPGTLKMRVTNYARRIKIISGGYHQASHPCHRQERQLRRFPIRSVSANPAPLPHWSEGNHAGYGGASVRLPQARSSTCPERLTVRIRNEMRSIKSAPKALRPCCASRSIKDALDRAPETQQTRLLLRGFLRA